MKVIRPDTQTDKLFQQCQEAEDTGKQTYPGMTYEQGILAVLDWLTNMDAPHPLNEE